MAVTVHRIGKVARVIGRTRDPDPVFRRPVVVTMGNARLAVTEGRKKTIEELARECGLRYLDGRVG